VLGVVVAKQVGELPQNDPATWTFPSVIPVEVSALLRTKNNEEVVALPVASRQIVSFVIPPHAPNESEPTLTSLIMVVPFTFTLPENPITGPPSLTEPDVIWTSTHTEVLEMLKPLQVPPWVRVTVPTCVPPTSIMSVIEVAEAAGTVAKATPMTNAKIEGLKLLLCTDGFPPLENTSGCYPHGRCQFAKRLPND
jgi:hypothetical protein